MMTNKKLKAMRGNLLKEGLKWDQLTTEEQAKLSGWLKPDYNDSEIQAGRFKRYERDVLAQVTHHAEWCENRK